MLKIRLYLILAVLKINCEETSSDPYTESTSKIDSNLFASLQKGNTPNVIVSFIGGNEEPLERASQLSIEGRGERAWVIYHYLLKHSDKSQSGVEQILSRRSDAVQFKKFWISNQMWVSGADYETILMIAQDPQVIKIKEEGIMEMLDGESDETRENRSPAPRPGDGFIQWNIERVQAREAWAELGGKGEGIVVGIIDSGVRVSHETLRENFLGDYGWIDYSHYSYEETLQPWASNSHGTFVAGIAVGRRGIGVAPGAKWAACKACNTLRECTHGHTLSCMEFFACPTLANGTGRDCSKVPHVIANAWGGEKKHFKELEDAIQVWLSIGIIPVFGIGNNGESCESTMFPGNLAGVIGVGSVDIDNSAEGVNTSRGPTSDRRKKPDIVAPGEEIVGPTAFGDEKYYIKSGTSFACAHVVGVIALVLSLDDKMGYEMLTQILFNSTEQDSLQVPEEFKCGAVQETLLVFPNNVYGYGLVNALKAVRTQKEWMEKYGSEKR